VYPPHPKWSSETARDLVKRKIDEQWGTVEHMVKETGIVGSKQTVYNYLNGDREPSSDLWYRICDLLGLAPLSPNGDNANSKQTHRSHARQHAITLPLKGARSRSEVVRDRKEIERRYGDRVPDLEVWEHDSNSMDGQIPKGRVLVDTGASFADVGPGTYLLRRHAHEGYHVTYLDRPAADQWVIKYSNCGQQTITRDEDGVWRNGDGHQVDLDVRGKVVEWVADELPQR